MCAYQLERGAVRHDSKQFLKEHGLYKKQVNPHTTQRKCARRRRRGGGGRVQLGESGGLDNNAVVADAATPC